MKRLTVWVCLLPWLAACVSSSDPPPPSKSSTIVVPQSGEGTTVVCQDGSKPPCN